MAIRLTIQEDRPKLKVGHGGAIPLRASSGYPVYENNYDNLRNKPSINGVTLSGDKTTEDLHIQVSGGVTSVNGQTGAVSLTIPTVPTNVSAFNNDAGYITSAALPTKVSDLTNDSGYLTLATLPIWDGGVI